MASEGMCSGFPPLYIRSASVPNRISSLLPAGTRMAAQSRVYLSWQRSSGAPWEGCCPAEYLRLDRRAGESLL
jgi:hypothetical protein